MKSMTGYAALDRNGRRWELRSVNARGLDIRLRLPDRPAGLEPAVRAALAGLGRGNVTVSLRMTATAETAGDALVEAARSLLAAEAAADEAGLDLRPATPADVLSLASGRGADLDVPLETLGGDLVDLVAAFDADRLREGAALHGILAGQIAEIADLTAQAADLIEARANHIAETFRAAFRRLTDAAPEAAMDPTRVAQEVAALAVKADITEEIDRLGAHGTAARDLLAADGPVGRRLDFLTQEFMREANTLCSKSNMAELTTIGLALKAAIDRLREQVQNVE
ncbi:MAG: DUF1732 domain-containing protein [Pseudomonadota bacterium]